MSTKSKFFMEFWGLCALKIGSLTCGAAFNFISIILPCLILFEVLRYFLSIDYTRTLLPMSMESVHILNLKLQWWNFYFPDGREFLVDRKASLSTTLHLILGLTDLLIGYYCRRFNINECFSAGVVVVYS